MTYTYLNPVVYTYFTLASFPIMFFHDVYSSYAGLLSRLFFWNTLPLPLRICSLDVKSVITFLEVHFPWLGYIDS